MIYIRYFVVFQNKTFLEESNKSILWAPKKDKAGNNAKFHWKTMTECKPGDIVFSVVENKIVSRGIVKTQAITSNNPFVNKFWNKEGWLLELEYDFNIRNIKIKNYINQLSDFLPEKYSPFNKTTGRGNQGYLYSIGDELGVFLDQLILIKQSRSIPLEDTSWRKIADILLFKTIDKSVLLNNNIQVPEPYHNFFMNRSVEKKDIKLIYHNVVFKGTIVKIDIDNSYSQYYIQWSNEFVDFIKKSIGSLKDDILNNQNIDNLPEIRFEKLSDKNFGIEIVNYYIIEEGIKESDLQSEISQKEGKQKAYYTTKYERNTILRKQAIEFHGTRCVVCGFDFYKKYGERGKGFIEIHHKKPLYQIDGEIYVDPKHDLVPVCSNCHRMIHRFKDDYLSIEDLDRIVKQNE